MSNRLEHEFPMHRWQPVPPIRSAGLSHDVLQRYLAHGHRLRSVAFRRSARTAAAAALRALARLVRFGWCADAAGNRLTAPRG